MKKDIIYNLFYLFFERNQWQKCMIQFTYYLWLRHYNKTCQINFGTLNIVKKVYSSQTPPNVSFGIYCRNGQIYQNEKGLQCIKKCKFDLVYF